MRTCSLFLRYLFVVVVVVASLAGPALPPEQARAAPAAQQDPLILSYAAKFVCQEALAAGQYWYGLGAPIVQQKTEVLIHNPNAFPVTLYKKAVRAPIENFTTSEQGVEPGKWREVRLRPDYAFRIDCDDIAKLLTSDPAATSLGTFGLGNTVEGFVVIGIGPQPVAGTPAVTRFPQLDVTAEYARSSEVMKKDIHYQPWWRYWWWGLPWQLGHPYRRVLRLQTGIAPASLDVQKLVVEALVQEAQEGIDDEAQRNATVQALRAGLDLPLEPGPTPNDENKPVLNVILGSPEFFGTADGAALSVDYVVVSNRSPADPNPITGAVEQPITVRYPWFPGRWYDLPVVMSQNIRTDMHQYFAEWHIQEWIKAGGDENRVRAAMTLWFPYWCGWGYWWWSWRGSDCIDIGVGEGESLDVEQITPVRVFYPQWPPANQ
jgi:hypothetical protein